MRQGQVGTRGVVAAAVQQHHIARLDARQIGDHALKIDAARFSVEIAVLGHFHAKVFDDRRVVRPGRVGQPDRRIGAGQLYQLQRLTYGPGAAGGCHRRHAICRNRIAQDQRLHRGGIFGVARKAGIAFAALGFPQLLFRRFHCAHYRGQAGRVLVDADAEVDPGVAGVILEHLDEL